MGKTMLFFSGVLGVGENVCFCFMCGNDYKRSHIHNSGPVSKSVFDIFLCFKTFSVKCSYL